MAKSTFSFKAAALIAAGGLFMAGCGSSSSTSGSSTSDGNMDETPTMPTPDPDPEPPTPPTLAEAAAALLRHLNMPGTLPDARPAAVDSAIANLRIALGNTGTEEERTALRTALDALKAALTANEITLSDNLQMAMTQLEESEGFPPAPAPDPTPPDLGEAASALLQSLGMPGALPGALPDTVTTAINNLRDALAKTETDADKAALRNSLSTLQRAVTAANTPLSEEITTRMEAVRMALGDPQGNFAALDNLTSTQRADLRHAFNTLSNAPPHLGSIQLSSAPRVAADTTELNNSISTSVTPAGVYEITIWNELTSDTPAADTDEYQDPMTITGITPSAGDQLLWKITSGPDNSVDLNDLHDGFRGKKLTREIGEEAPDAVGQGTVHALVYSDYTAGTGGAADSDYMTAGFWMFVPSSPTGAFHAGAFADGSQSFPDLDTSSANTIEIAALTGQATYHGMFRGMHTHSVPGGSEFDELTGNVNLDADFGNSTDAGSIHGSITGLQISGTDVDGNILLRGTADSSDATFGTIPNDLGIAAADFGENRVFGNVGGMIGTGEIISGNWVAELYGPGDAMKATQHPSGVGGVLGGRTDDGQTIMGSFLAHDQ